MTASPRGLFDRSASLRYLPEESLGEAEISDDADVLALAKVGEAAFKALPVGEIIFWLQDLVTRQPFCLGGGERRLEHGGGQIRRPAPADLALFDQPLIGAERLFDRRRHIRPVREIKVDHIRLQPLKRGFGRLGDVGRLEPFLSLAHRRADLGDDDHAAAIAARFIHSPMINSNSPPLLPRNPGRIGVGGVDRGQPRRGEPVHDGEGGLFVRRPPEYVAAEHERRDGKIGAS